MAGVDGEVFPEKSSTGGGLRVLFLGLGSRLEGGFGDNGSFFGWMGGKVTEEGGRKALFSGGGLLRRLELLALELEEGEAEALFDSYELLESLREELELEDTDELGEFEDSEANS